MTRKIYLGFLYTIEKQSYMLVVLTCAIYSLNASELAASTGCLQIVVGLFIMVIFNETIISHFEAATTGVYDLRWYELSPRDQRCLIPVLQALQQPILLSSGGITDLTFEWFMHLVQSGYSAGLLLLEILSR